MEFLGDVMWVLKTYGLQAGLVALLIGGISYLVVARVSDLKGVITENTKTMLAMNMSRDKQTEAIEEQNSLLSDLGRTVNAAASIAERGIAISAERHNANIGRFSGMESEMRQARILLERLIERSNVPNHVSKTR